MNHKFFSWAALFFLTMGLIFCSSRPDRVGRDGELMIGVKIYDYGKDFPDLFEEWRSLGINTAMVSVPLLSSDRFRGLAKEYGIRIFVIIPIFYDPEELQRNPDLYAVTGEGKKAVDEWVNFVCPTREDYLAKKIDSIKEIIQEWDPEGISLDFIRHFVFWEKVYPGRSLPSIPNTCFDSHCLDRFQRATSIKIPERFSTVPEKAKWITTNHLKEWTEWKCSVITGAVKVIAREIKRTGPDTLINIHTVPWRESDFGGALRIIAGQDLAALSAFTDFVSPMCYSHMLKREPPWISSVVGDVYEKTHNRVIPSIQVKEAYLPEVLPLSEFKDALAEALKPPSSGVIFWSWEALDRDPEKKDAIKDLLHKEKSKMKQ
jgi:hypothetical protein